MTKKILKVHSVHI